MRPSYADRGVERGREDSAVAGGRASATDLGDFRRQTTVTCRASPRDATHAARVSAAATQEHQGDSKRRRRLSCTEQQPSDVTQRGRLQQSNSQQQQQQWQVQQRQGWQSQRPRHTWEQALHQPNVQQQKCRPEGHQRRSEERQEHHYLLHSSSRRPRWKQQERWLHSSTEQQQDHPFLQEEAGTLGVSDVRSQLYEQEKLQQDLGASVQRQQQQQLQHRGGRPVQQQCFPRSSADAWSAAATAAAEVPRGCPAAADASTYHTGETRQNFTDAGVKTGRSSNGSRNWRSTSRKWESRRGSSSRDFGTSGTEESRSNSWGRGTVWRTNGSNRRGENNSYRRYSGSCTEESRSSSREETGSNTWRERRCCNGEDGSSGQENSTLNSGSRHAYTDQFAETATAESAGQWLPNEIAVSNCYSAPLVTAESTLESSTAPAAAGETLAGIATQAPATALRATASVETGTQGAGGRTHAECWTSRQAAAEADWHPGGAEAAAAPAAENEKAQGTAGTARDKRDAAVGLPAAACSGGVSVRGNRRSTGEHESDVYAGVDAACNGGGVRAGVQAREGQDGCSRKQRESLSLTAALVEDIRGQSPTHLPAGAHSLAAVAASGTREPAAAEAADACLPSAAPLVCRASAAAEDTESVVRGIAAAAAPARLCGCSRSGCCCFCVSGVGGGSVRDGEIHVEKQAAAAAAVSGGGGRGTTQFVQHSAAATEAATAALGVAEGGTGAKVTEGGTAAASAVTDEGRGGAALAAKEESELRAYLRRVEALNEVLLSNISSLYKTAKVELERKDAAIAEKDRQIADLFSKLRERVGGGPQEHQQQRGSHAQELHKKYQRQAWQQRLEQPTTFEQQQQQHLRQQQQQLLPPYRPPRLQKQQHYLREQLTAKQQRFPQLLKGSDHSTGERRYAMQPKQLL